MESGFFFSIFWGELIKIDKQVESLMRNNALIHGYLHQLRDVYSSNLRN
jgi:hypothetical protein